MDSWTVQFNSVSWFSGVIVLTLKDRVVSGTDGRHICSGTYMQDGRVLTSRVRVKRIDLQGDELFALDLTGTVEGDSGKAIGQICGTHTQLTGEITKQV
jgi:hypothetical protein